MSENNKLTLVAIMLSRAYKSNQIGADFIAPIATYFLEISNKQSVCVCAQILKLG